MRRTIPSIFLAAAMVLSCAACASAAPAETVITLSDSGVKVDGKAASTKSTSAVYTGADIIYYASGKDETYGAGTEADSHSADEAAAHTVVTITQPGTYRLTGTLSRGQVAVDLGEDAKTDPGAVVTLILDGVDITCTVAPAVIFYNVYECGSDDLETVAPTVDTAKAGANVVIADGTVNDITGSYVAKIYKEGTEKKLHKYDGAFYSKMSMNVTGESAGDGVLNIVAENEGLDAELHLTINGGVINITAQDDGINTNEDGVSVTTVNGGVLTINAGLGDEGDGIDSNGFLVINGGTVATAANPRSGDGGLDSDKGIYLNGGTVFATGSRNDSVETASEQPYLELTFSGTVATGQAVALKDSEGRTVMEFSAVKDFSSLILSSPDLELGGTYTLYVDGVQQQYTGTGAGRMGPGGFPEGMEPPADGQRPEHAQGGQRPDRDQQPPEDGFDRGQGGGRPGGMGEQADADRAGSTAFVLTEGSMRFSGVSDAKDLPFTDVSEGDAYYDAVRYLYGLGVMNGTSDTAFSPDEPVSRAMAVTVLARLAGAAESETAEFSDVAAGSWYSGYVGWAVDRGIVEGDGQGHFLPDQAVTGEQMGLMLGRYYAGYAGGSTSTQPLTRGELAQMLMEAQI